MANDKDAATGGLSYRDAGVDIDAASGLIERIKPLAKATFRPGVASDIGGFGALFDLKAAGYADPVLIAATDGVGTKLKIAIDAGRHDTVGIDLVAMCVNDLIVQGGEPLLFLDYFACGTLDADIAEAVISGIAEGCRQAGAALIGGETAEMPGLYARGDYDLAGFAIGAVERGQGLPRGPVRPGDAVIGIASSGAHSNGYSLIRKVVEKTGLAYDADAPFAPGRSLGEALLEPTRIYAKPALAAHRQVRGLKAYAHITGGGFDENIPRSLPQGLGAAIDLSALRPQAVFGWLAESGDIAEREMLKTFNCGIGLVAIAAADAADAVCAAFAECGESAAVIGEIEARDGGDAIRYGGALRPA